MPFSPFLGADRVLIPLSPEGVTLEIDGALRSVPQHVGLEFRGEDRVVADTGGGHVTVVNLMSRRSSGQMSWEIHRGPCAMEAGNEAVIVLGGDVRVAAERLAPGTVILSAVASRLSVGGDGVLALLRMEPRSMSGIDSVAFATFSTFGLFSASTASSRRRTVNGRTTDPYSAGLNGPRSGSAMFQMKLT